MVKRTSAKERGEPLMKENLKFIWKATAAHFATYLVCGLVFANLFDYQNLFELDNVKYFMKDAYGNSSLIGPFVQIIRGILIGAVLLILKDNVLQKKHSWLYLWILFAGLGIICTPAAAPASIEGLVYSQLPLEFHLKTAPELLVQTLLFSLWVTGGFRFRIPQKHKDALIVTVISGAVFGK